MLCIFFGREKKTTLGKAMYLFCLKDIGSQRNVAATSKSSSYCCPNHVKKNKIKSLWNSNVIPHPNQMEINQQLSDQQHTTENYFSG